MKKPSLSCQKQMGGEGFSLPIAVLAGFLLLLGSLALASRSSWGLFGSAFQSKNWAARSAAETGMNTIVSELNRPQNRWLTVVRRNNNGDQDPDYQNNNSGDLWEDRNESAKILELRQNPCIVTQSPPASSETPDYSRLDPSNAASTSYGKWYVSNDGQISSAQGTATRSFRLARITRQPYAGAIGDNQRDINGDGSIDEKDRYLSVWRDRTDNPSGVGTVTIQVEGQSYQNGQVVASVILERTYELTPKCCDVPFGGKHGNINYAVENSGEFQGTTVCLTQLGLGLLAGAEGNDTGSVRVRGRATDVEDEDEVPVNPIYCLASNQAGCAINSSDPDIDVAIVDTQLPEAYTFCNPRGGTGIYLTDPCTGGAPRSSGYFADDSAITTDSACSSTAFKKICGSGAARTIVYDFSATPLPQYCTRTRAGEVNCNIAGGALSDASRGNSNISFITGGNKVRLFFQDNGEVIDASGNTTISNCTSVSASGICTPSANITDLSLFGKNRTNTTDTQTLTLRGTPDATNLFIYFPIATVNLTGDATFSGVLWTNNLQSTGNPTWIIPSSGLADVFELMGLTSGIAGEIEPLFYDFVLRGTNKQRWLGG